MKKKFTASPVFSSKVLDDPIIDEVIDKLNDYYEKHNINIVVGHSKRPNPNHIEVAVGGFPAYNYPVKYTTEELNKLGKDKVVKKCVSRAKNSISKRKQSMETDLKEHEMSLIDEKI